jgi:hypothetical protein
MLATLLLVPASIAGQGSVRVYVRAGALASTPMVVDTIARVSVLRQLGITAQAAEDERIHQGVSPVGEVAVGTRLRAGLWLEAAGGVTLARIGSRAGARTIQSVLVPHASVGLSYDLRERVHVRGGFGGIRYGGGEGLLAGSGGIQPMVHASAGTSLALVRRLVHAELFAQGHTFGTPALRRMGGVDGRVLRYGVRAGVGFGGPR